METNSIPLETIAAIPNVQGVVRCQGNAESPEASNSEAEVFGNVIMYLQQVAGLIGESFGLEDLEEVQLQGKNTTALCLSFPGETLGVVVGSKAKTAEVVSKIRALKVKA